MKIYKTKNYEEMSRKAAHIISAQVTLKPDSVLGLATGSTPIGTYENLVKWYEDGDLDFSGITTVNLERIQSFHGTMTRATITLCTIIFLIMSTFQTAVHICRTVQKRTAIRNADSMKS